MDYVELSGNLFCTPTPKPSTPLPPSDSMKGDLEEQNTPYPTYLHLRQLWKREGVWGGGGVKSTWDIREVKWIAPLGLGLYAGIIFSSKHNLLLLSEAAVQLR